MNNLHKRFRSMASLHFLDHHATEGFHFHAYFFFFADAKLPCPPSKLEDRMRATVFKTWNKLNGGRLAQCANLLTRPPVLSPDYFLKKLRALAANAPSLRRPANWWTKRNQAAFRANMTIPDERAVAATFNRYFNRRKRRRRACRSEHLRNGGLVSLPLANGRISALLHQPTMNSEDATSVFSFS
ncbi:MAG: hypothetical protein ABJF10_14060 [Chthoniobacter sp.]